MFWNRRIYYVWAYAGTTIRMMNMYSVPVYVVPFNSQLLCSSPFETDYHLHLFNGPNQAQLMPPVESYRGVLAAVETIAIPANFTALSLVKDTLSNACLRSFEFKLRIQGTFVDILKIENKHLVFKIDIGSFKLLTNGVS